jgi:hypothetical protein
LNGAMSDEQTIIDQLVARWDELQAEGQHVSAEQLCAVELCGGSPQLTARVKARIEHPHLAAKV